MGTHTPDDQASTLTDAIPVMGVRKSDDTLQLLSAVPSDEDYAGRPSFNTVWGDKITTERHADIEEQFQYNINTKTLTTTLVGSATATQANSMAKLTTGTTTTGSAMLESVNVIRYRPSYEAWAYFTVIFENGGVADSTQHIGPFTTDDGYYVGYGGTGATGTEFVVGMKFDGTQTNQVEVNWNGDVYFQANYDPTKLNIFRISYGWLGTAPISFEYFGEDGAWHVIHTMNHTNTLIQPTTSNPQLPICLDITKTAGATDIVAYTASWGGGINGTDDGAGDRYFTGSVAATNVSTEQVLINFQNVSTFQSKTNRVSVEAVLLGMSTEGNKPAIIKIYKNLAITSPTWANVDATNSVMQTDTAGTVTPADSNLLFAFPLARSDSLELGVSGKDFVLYPSETATVTGTSSVNNDITFTARWKERF